MAVAGGDEQQFKVKVAPYVGRLLAHGKELSEKGSARAEELAGTIRSPRACLARTEGGLAGGPGVS
jgi:hypothetical protein